jgi:hypothetical protein
MTICSDLKGIASAYDVSQLTSNVTGNTIHLPEWCSQLKMDWADRASCEAIAEAYMASNRPGANIKSVRTELVDSIQRAEGALSGGNDIRGMDVIATEGESGVIGNMRRKAGQADAMFSELVKHMNAAQRIEREATDTNKMEIPSWV